MSPAGCSFRFCSAACSIRCFRGPEPPSGRRSLVTKSFPVHVTQVFPLSKTCTHSIISCILKCVCSWNAFPKPGTKPRLNSLPPELQLDPNPQTHRKTAPGQTTSEGWSHHLPPTSEGTVPASISTDSSHLFRPKVSTPLPSALV